MYIQMQTITMYYSKVGVFPPAFCLLNPLIHFWTAVVDESEEWSLSINGDQHQCSPCISNALSKKEVTFIQELRTWSHKIDLIDTEGSDKVLN